MRTLDLPLSVIRHSLPLVAVLCCAAVATRADDVAHTVNTAAGERRFEFIELHMGSPVQIVLYAATEEAAEAASREAFARVAAIDAALSDYRPDSELMLLCRNAVPGEPQPASDDLLNVLTRAQEISHATDGAFDVTVGPLVQLWRASRKSKTLPTPDELAAARDRVGWESYQVDLEARTVTLLKSDMQIDFGGIATGYAADAALAVLSDHGIRSAMVNASGDIVVSDAPPGRDGWRVAIAPLKSDSHANPEFTTLVNRAVTTSGDAYQFVEIDGERYAHIVDPSTGLGLRTRCSATVMADDCMTADAWATALCILGHDAGLTAVASEPGAQARLSIINQDGNLETHASPEFPAAAVNSCLE
jgi:thiamine biosynthesis lipoprotein